MKKKLLFIEDQILHFDQAAGARTSYMYLQLLIESGISVTFIGADFKDTEPYTSHLRSVGIKVLTGKWFQRFWKQWFLLFVRQFDYVFFNRPQPTKQFIDFVEKFSTAKILYQCHDLHYLRLLRQYEIDGDEETLKTAHWIEEIETEIIQRSDVLLTFSRFEKETIEKKLPGHRTEVIPLFFYDTLIPPITDFSQRKGILYVGGFKHQPNVDAVLWFSREILPEIKKNCSEMVFYIVGSHPPIEVSGLAEDGTEVLGFVSDEKLTELYSQVKLVVVPLRFGAGVKGKTVEAIHHSLPLVSTGIGSEGIGLETIIPATDTPETFANRVLTLYENELALRECSSQLHDYARDNLTKSAAKAKMEQILISLS
jgi:glycosyltransferase involved in cell wall biosynthesis